MLFKRNYFFVSVLGALVALLSPHKLQAQRNKDSSACLIRFKAAGVGSYKIPMTNYCFVREAGINKDYSNGWVMKWDIVKKTSSNLLFLEMNATDVKGWESNESIRGSVQLVFELPAFNDSISLTKLSYKSKGLYVINNYGGSSTKKQFLYGNLTIKRNSENIIINSSLNLTTEKPNTKQQFILIKSPVQAFTFDQYQEFENQRDSLREAEKDMMVNALTEAIMSRDSIWEIENYRIADSLKLHPYTGKFRFWISDINKPGYTRITYFINEDSLIIKKGPYDFIYLAKNYTKDSVYFRRALNQKEKAFLSDIERRIETDTLKTRYKNNCAMDGLILSFSFESAQFSKDVTVSNYYNESIANVVEFINKITPKEYRIWYDKKVLLKRQSECDR